MGQADVRFVELMSELFQLHEAEELDFGIYRIIRRHNARVREFLGEVVDGKGHASLQGGQLTEILDQTFTKLASNATHDKHLRLEQLQKDLGIAPSLTSEQIEHHLTQVGNAPAIRMLVEEYRAIRQEQKSHDSAGVDRYEVLNRLYEFFSHHYQDGDFIVQRRYGKSGARWLRSTGDDTEFHWATEDMYYIKSGDIFTDYTVRLSNGKELVFSVDPDSLQKTRATLNPQDNASYCLKSAKIQDGVSQIVLEYVKGAAKGSKKQDEIAQAASKLTAAGEDEIKRHLRRYVARNQSDFFIHRKLRESLEEDLDIFIKTDVLNAEQLLAANTDNLPARALRVAQAIRSIGRQIIAFLGVLEEFQKQLWEKKKLVFETRYIISLDRIDRLAGREWLEARLSAIIQTQQQEWKELGLGTITTPGQCRVEIPGDLLNEARRRYLPLPVDTRHFENAFKWELLEAVTKEHGLDENIDGVALHSDNWQALQTIEEKYREQVKCIYIDPPYNTNASGIPYKNGYRHASWATLMHNRVERLARFMRNDGAIFVSIDKVERTPLEHLLSRIFGTNNKIEELIWIQNTNDGKSPTYSTNHEYVEVYAKQRMYVEQDRDMFREPKPGYAEVMDLVERLNPDYPPIALVEAELKTLYKTHLNKLRDEAEAQGLDWNEVKRNDPWKGLYAYSNAEYRDDNGRYVPEAEAKDKQAKIWIWQEDNWTIMSSETKQSETIRDPSHPNFRYYQPLHPTTKKPCSLSSRGWKGTQFVDPEHPERNSFESLLMDHRIAFGPDEKKVPRQKRMLHEVETNVSKSFFHDYSDGEKQTTAMFGKAGIFLAPKHTDFVSRFIMQGSNADSYVLDCFGGSGSTAHAVLEINRIEKTHRKFITVEVNKYFETLIIPRLKKAGASASWQSGTAKSLDGPGLFMRVQRLEQYEETLENLAAMEGETPSLFDGENALAYQLNADTNSLFLNQNAFTTPNGYTLKQIEGTSPVQREVDLVESLIYLLGLKVYHLYREAGSVVITGTSNRRNEKIAVFWRGGDEHSEKWLSKKMQIHKVDQYYTNNLSRLSFDGIQRFRSIEQVFSEQMGGKA